MARKKEIIDATNVIPATLEDIMTTILVDPISRRENFFSQFSRMAETRLWKRLAEQNIIRKGHYYGSL